MTIKNTAKLRILEAATALMWRNGYDAISVDAICEVANVRKGSFYHAFASKEGLLNTIIERVWDRDRLEIELCYAVDATPLVRFRNHLEWFGITQRRLRAQFGFVPGTFNMAVAVNAPQAAREISAEASRQHTAMLAKGVADLLQSQEPSQPEVQWWSEVVGQLINGVLIQARIYNSLTPFDKFPETVLALMGMGSKPLDFLAAAQTGLAGSI
jgi:TetR/AcrR family transcriptional repressor of nem operon